MRLEPLARMTHRRLAAAFPPAILVAVLAHLAGFGGGHAPGGDHAADLFSWLGAALGLSALRTFFGSVVPPRGSVIATKTFWCRAFPTIAAVAAASFAAIEFAEGHRLDVAGTLGAALALLPLAGLVALLARYVGRAVASAGHRFAAYGRSRVSNAAPVFAFPASSALVPHVRCGRGTNRGRAPPLPA